MTDETAKSPRARISFLRRSGGSLITTIPNDVVRAIDAKDGDAVTIAVAGPNELRINRVAAAGKIVEMAVAAPMMPPVNAGTTRRGRYGGDWTITVLVPENPKRWHGKSRRRFDLHQSGITVDQYIERSIAAGNDRQLALADLRWDADKKFIAITPPSARAA
jgi:antitoxin component of MazEF toxin-antitoxin module